MRINLTVGSWYVDDLHVRALLWDDWLRALARQISAYHIPNNQHYLSAFNFKRSKFQVMTDNQLNANCHSYWKYHWKDQEYFTSGVWISLTGKACGRAGCPSHDHLAHCSGEFPLDSQFPHPQTWNGVSLRWRRIGCVWCVDGGLPAWLLPHWCGSFERRTACLPCILPTVLLLRWI